VKSESLGPKDLATRVFENSAFQIAWAISIGCVFVFVGLPFQRFLVVLWVKGSDAYFHHGIRVLRGKPAKFSDGELLPQLPDAVTGFAVFLAIAFGLSALMCFALRFYEKHFQKRSRAA
jgi:hypothetical protein